ncbi:unnamed protein product [Litomosoides sigmodontis]|uniref:E2F/DP family winged-helix DNA-binding domain-containing protein n=1 Tax=Litomosoides sigmodontis TaxID=42156 RepID=A0A3P6UHH1_LITSI|nr:unnamed protein product [Litomosoides sigmodontis]
MHGRPSTSGGNYWLSNNCSSEDEVHCQSQCDEYVRSVLRCKEQRKKLYAGIKRPLLPIFQSVEDVSMSKQLLVKENQPSLAGNSNVNSCVDGAGKRKALKTRNDVEENAQFTDTTKIKQNGNGSTLKRAAIQWTLEEEFSENKDEIEWNKSFIIPPGSCGMWSGAGEPCKRGESINLDEQVYGGGLSEFLRKIKWDENFAISSAGNRMCNGSGSIHCNQYARNERASGNLRNINWNANFAIEQHDRPASSDGIVKRRNAETLNSQERGGSDGKIIRVDIDDEINGSRNDLSAKNNNRNASANVKSDMGGEESKQPNDSILMDVEEVNGSGNENERSGNVADESNDGEASNENAAMVQDDVDKLGEKKDEQNRNTVKCQNDTEEASTSFPRKTKTLGLLCRKFLLEVLEHVNCGDGKINLETIASSMKVEKRRIYDVVNVMEALGAMKKSHKSFYTWEGLDNLPSILYKLKIEAEKEGVYQKVLMMQHVMTRFVEIPNINGNVSGSSDDAGPSHTPDDNVAVTEHSNSSGNNDSGKSASSKQLGAKKKANKRQRGLNSLTYLCKYFFKILIVGLDYQSDYKVSLDVASTILIKDPETVDCKPPDRSRCRRIYDVANVLISLLLIERKMFTFGTKKIPLFVYCGPKITENGTFDFFNHIRSNKLSESLKNSEEKRAYEVEEENLETFFLKINKNKRGGESSNSADEPMEKRSRNERTYPVQENADVEKENVPVSAVNQILPPPQGVASIPIIRPQPQKTADLTAILASQPFVSFNNLQSVMQQSALASFMPLPVCAQEFLTFDPSMMFLSNGTVLHSNITSSPMPIQQNSFNYFPMPYPLSPMAFFQQSSDPGNGNVTFHAHNNITSDFFQSTSANTPRSSMFNIDSILGSSGTYQNNEGQSFHPERFIFKNNPVQRGIKTYQFNGLQTSHSIICQCLIQTNVDVSSPTV